MHIELARTTSASPADVWAVVTDIEGTTEVLTGVTAIERVDDGTGFGVGTRWRETRTLFGKEGTEELYVTAVDEGRSYTVEADSHGTHYVSRLFVEPSGDGSRVRMTFGADQTGRFSKFLARTIGRTFEGATKKALQQDLDEIVAAAEARSS